MKIRFYLISVVLFANVMLKTNFRKAPAPTVRNLFSDLPVLETECLVLRPVHESDVEDLFEVYSDAEVLRFMPLRLREKIEDIEAKVAWFLKRYKDGKPAPWVIVLKETNKVIGLCGFFHWVERFAYAEIMNLLARDYWGQGIMTEAKRAVIAYAFSEMGLNRIQSSVYPGNVASLRVNEKLGFKVVGIVPEYAYYKGSYWDRMVLSLLKSDFLRLEKENAKSCVDEPVIE